MMISVTILVKNGQSRLGEVLNALKKFDEIILLDTGSTDQTLEIAKDFSNVAIHHAPLQGFGPTHNLAASLAKNDWILSIDDDEVVTPELAEEILSLNLNPDHLYTLPFFNFFNGKKIKWCGWYPEKHTRLYHRKKTGFTDAMVHEGVMTKNLQPITLRNPVHHHSYDSLSDFLTKMEHYSTLFAEQHRAKRKSSPLIALYHGVGGFLKSYFLKKGFMGGYEGFLISVYNGHTAFYKYLKLYHANATRPHVPQSRDRETR